MGDAIMSDNISIIGGADGPTSVFVAGKLGMNWLSDSSFNSEYYICSPGEESEK